MTFEPPMQNNGWNICSARASATVSAQVRFSIHKMERTRVAVYGLVLMYSDKQVRQLDWPCNAWLAASVAGADQL